MLMEPFPTNLLEPNSYICLQDRKSENTDGDECDSETVMINVHMIKTKLQEKTKRDKDKRKYKRLTLGSQQTSTVAILAIGNSETIHIPIKSSYHDPLNVWQSETVFVKCKSLTEKIREIWAKMCASKPPADPVNPNPTANCTEVAPHIAIDHRTGNDTPKIVEIKPLTRGFRVSSGGLELFSHKPKTESDILYQHLSEQESFISKCHELQAAAHIQGHGSDYQSTQIDSLFNKATLPTSFQYPTTKFKHLTLERPNQLGTDGMLVLLCDNMAHIKFVSKEGVARLPTEEEKRECIRNVLKSCPISQDK